MDKEFFENSEQSCINKMEQFINKHNFNLSETGATPSKYDYDYSGVCKTLDREVTYAFELKDRNYSLDTFNKWGNIIIEAHKLSELYLHYVMYGIIPIYINFTSDGKVILFNLSKLKDKPKYKLYKGIKSKGYQRIEEGSRFELSMSDAKIFDL